MNHISNYSIRLATIAKPTYRSSTEKYVIGLEVKVGIYFMRELLEIGKTYITDL